MFNTIFKIHPPQNCIKWNYYCPVFNKDSINMLKICHKISIHHIELNNLSKIKIKYTTQVIFFF